jgi:hypothetical protein
MFLMMFPQFPCTPHVVPNINPTYYPIFWPTSVERIYKFFVGSVWPPMFGKFYIESVQSFGNNVFG